MPIRFTLLMALAFGLYQCDENVQEWETESADLVITDYIAAHTDQFSEFNGILIKTGIDNLFRIRGPYTLMLPTDEAMKEYYTRMNVASYKDLDNAVLTELVYNHVFGGAIATANIGLGKLMYKNGLGDAVASELPGTDIVLNKQAKIIKRDIKVSNGYIHYIDHVIDVIRKDIFAIISEQPGLSIFTQGLVKAGLADTLKVLSFTYGTANVRTSYTLLAVPDTLYQRQGINSIDDLIATYATGTNYTDTSNGLYKYMVYHCLSNAQYFSDLKPQNVCYLINNENYLEIKVEDDFKINSNANGYTGFYIDESNIPAKNGVIHTINSQLPVAETAPAKIIFQVTDYFDFKQGSWYQNNYQRFYDGQNTFKGIKWDAEYLLYYFKNEDAFMDADGLAISGHFWIELTTPKIRKGKYDLSSYMFGGGIDAWYVDGEYLGQLDVGTVPWNGESVVGEVNFTETKEHKIKLKTLVPGGIFWDRITFLPK